MKRYIVVSIILHALIISVALFLIPQKKEKELKPFIARIVNPEEAANDVRPPERKPDVKEKNRQNKHEPSGRILTKEKNVPKTLSSVPSNPSAKKSALGPRALTRKVPPKGGRPRQVPDTGSDRGLTTNRSIAESEQSKTPGVKQSPLREKLFDRDIIAKSARKEQEGTKEGSSITFDTREFKYYGYMQRLRDKIQNVWKYPPGAAEKGIYGDLYIEFTIKKNGKLGAVQLVRTSGYRDLDEYAIKALKEADPYWPLPDDIKEQSLTITGHFIYSLYGQYIR